MKNKILILGSTGLIGHQINFLLSNNPKYEISNIAYRNKLHEDTLLLDIMDEAILNSAIQKIKPNFHFTLKNIVRNANQSFQNGLLIRKTHSPTHLTHKIS